MSKIEKISIQGIRSFNPDRGTQLEFYTPLTIIVGCNGTGKTTVIESLKYITTGEHPPNTRGGAFLHDPKLTDSSTVKGQVKLKFRNINGDPMVCTRSMEVVQTKTALKFRTLESALLTVNPETNEKISVSGKCTDLDRDIPLQLGVPKPILDHVIFCHQEDSNWPLSEPSNVKKKFDEIFDATKYTKALKALKIIRRDQVNEIKHEQQKLDYLMTEVKRAEKIEANLILLKENKNEKQDTINGIDDRINELNEKCQHLSGSIDESTELKSKMNDLNYQKSIIDLNIQSIEANFTKLSDSEQQIKDKLSQYAQDEDSYQLEKIQLNNNESNIEYQMNKVNDEYKSKLSERVKFESQLKSLEDLANKKSKFVERVLNELQVSGTMRSEPFENVISQLIEYQQDKLDNEKIKNKQEIRDLNDTLNELKNQINNFKYELQSARTKLFDKEDELENVQTELNKLKFSSDSLDEITNQVQAKTDDLIELKNTFQKFEADDLTLDLNNQLAKYEDQMGLLASSLGQNQSGAMAKAKLEILEKDKNRFAGSVDRLMKEYEPEFHEHWGTNIDIDFISQDLSENIDYHENKLKNQQQRCQEHSQTQLLTENQLQKLTKDFNKKKSDLIQKESKIIELCEFDQFLNTLNEINENWESKIKELASLKSKMEIYSHFKPGSISNDHECPLCDRKFENSNEFNNFLNRIKSENVTLNDRIETLEKEIAQTERKKNQFKDLQPIYNELNHIKLVELKELENLIKLNQFKFDRSKKDHTELNSELQTLESKMFQLNSLNHKIQEINSLSKKLKEVQNEIDLLPKDDYGNEGQDNQSQFKLLQQKCTDFRMQIKQRKDEHTRLKLSFTETEHQLQNLQQKFELTQLQITQQTKLKETEATLITEIENLKSTMERQTSRQSEVNLDIEMTEKSILECESSNDETEKQLQHKLSNLYRQKTQFQSIESELENFESSDINESIQNCNKELKDLDAKLNQLKKESKLNHNKLMELNNLLSKAGDIKKNFEDNLQYIELGRKCSQLVADLESLQEKFNQIDLDSIQTEMNQSSEELNLLMDRKAVLMGQITQLTEEIDRNQTQLGTDYKSAIDNCNQQCVLVESITMINQDLDLYCKNLDASIMKFHSRKMDEINKIIRELWASTYQGTDIDTIEIKTNVESNISNRSYNYRVVMIKGDLEFDMRGRCSAGQKVLASIIIRLALAEAFSSKCGILALDEPTTNLDYENIQALAHSLTHIIKTRQAQKNFQLIVITHDEIFTCMLGKSECADYFFRIKKVGQISEIEKFPIDSL